MESQTPPPLPELGISTQSPDGEKKKRLAVLCVAGFFFAICFVAFGVLLVNKNDGPQDEHITSQPVTSSKQNHDTEATPSSPQQPTTSQAATPAVKPAPTPPASSQSSDRYLQIPEWGIKLKYTASGNYTLTYSLIDSVSLYLSTNELNSFAQSYSACTNADKGTILNRIKPGGYDSYYGQQWDESRLQSVQAVKVHEYYYVEFNDAVCSTQMPGVSFDEQQDFIELDSKIPFNNSVSGI